MVADDLFAPVRLKIFDRFRQSFCPEFRPAFRAEGGTGKPFVSPRVDIVGEQHIVRILPEPPDRGVQNDPRKNLDRRIDGEKHRHGPVDVFRRHAHPVERAVAGGEILVRDIRMFHKQIPHEGVEDKPRIAEQRGILPAWMAVPVHQSGDRFPVEKNGRDFMAFSDLQFHVFPFCSAIV